MSIAISHLSCHPFPPSNHEIKDMMDSQVSNTWGSRRHWEPGCRNWSSRTAEDPTPIWPTAAPGVCSVLSIDSAPSSRMPHILRSAVLSCMMAAGTAGAVERGPHVPHSALSMRDTHHVSSSRSWLHGP